MEEAVKEKGPERRKSAIKAVLFLFFVAIAFFIVQFTPVKNYLDQESLSQFLHSAGLWAPAAFVLFYAAGVCLFVPATILTGIGAAIFGPYRGFVYVWIGAMLGASASFYIGRTLAKDFASSLFGEKIQKYDDAIQRNGFAATLYLRLLYIPFTAMNFAMGITSVRFRDFIAGTGIGITAGTFLFTFFIGTLKEVWVSGEWGRLLSFKVFFSLGLFIFSFFIPKIVKKLSRKP